MHTGEGAEKNCDALPTIVTTVFVYGHFFLRNNGAPKGLVANLSKGVAVPWLCIQCSSENPDGQQICSDCGARLPFRPGEQATEDVAATERFAVPRQGELTGPLRHGLETFQDGTLSEEEFMGRLLAATENVPKIFAHLVEQVEAESEDLQTYGDGVVTSLLDCQALFLSGLQEMLGFRETADPGNLRLGWLLVEKGEEEYIRILKALKNDAKGERFRVDDLLGRLVIAYHEGVCSAEDFREQLRAFREHASETLDEVGRLVDGGLEKALDGGPEEESVLEEATAKLDEAAEKLGGLILNLYRP